MSKKPDYYLVTGGRSVPMMYHGYAGAATGNTCGGSTPTDSTHCINCGVNLTGTPPGRPGSPAIGATQSLADLASDNEFLLLIHLLGGYE